MSDLSKFFQPRSIAFVGATSDERKLGGRRFRSLVDGGFKGKIYAVHPSAKVVRGIPSYRTLLEIPSPVDLAVIVVPSDTVQSTIHDCATLGIPAIMLISAGFGEVDSEGRRIELSMVNEIRSTGGRLIGPNFPHGGLAGLPILPAFHRGLTIGNEIIQAEHVVSPKFGLCFLVIMRRSLSTGMPPRYILGTEFGVLPRFLAASRVAYGSSTTAQRAPNRKPS